MGQPAGEGDVEGAIAESAYQVLSSPATRRPQDTFGVVKTRKRGVVRARNAAQDRYLAALRKFELVFAEGPGGHRQDLARGRPRGVAARAGPGRAADPVAPGGRGRRAARLPARRHEGEGRSLPQADLRRALRLHGRAHGRARHPDRHDRDRAARLHARPDPVEGRGAARRGAERHGDADEDVPDPPRRGIADDGQRRSDPDRSRVRAEVGPRARRSGSCRPMRASAMSASRTSTWCGTISSARSSRPTSATDTRGNPPPAR